MIQIGVSWISPPLLPLIQQLARTQEVAFCEIMVDNMVHLPAAELKAALLDIPIALHFVSSRFLEKSVFELETLADYLRPWIKALAPIYVSDHLLRFTNTQGQWLPIVNELEYERDFLIIQQRVKTWQNLLDTKIYFENHASLTSQGKHQPVFFETLMRETGCGLLFDFSNAHIAEQNQVCNFDEWEKLIVQTQHFHIGGFRKDKHAGLLLDTHDKPLDETVLTRIQPYLKNKENTVVLEYDAYLTYEIWHLEQTRLQSFLNYAN